LVLKENLLQSRNLKHKGDSIGKTINPVEELKDKLVKIKDKKLA